MQALSLPSKSPLLQCYELLLALTETAADGNVLQATPSAAADPASKAARRGDDTIGAGQEQTNVTAKK